MRRVITALAFICLGGQAAADDLYVSELRKCYAGERNSSTKTCVVDGDTVWLSGNNLRLRDFDTPEPQSDICGGAFEVELAHRASDRLLELLNSNLWTVETFGLDQTGKRVLATIRINGRDVGDVLIDEGLARRWPDGDEWWCRGR
jgi:micrococcal nuclease